MINKERYYPYLHALFNFGNFTFPEVVQGDVKTYQAIIGKASELLQVSSANATNQQALIPILSQLFAQEYPKKSQYYFRPQTLQVVTESEELPKSIFPEESQAGTPEVDQTPVVEELQKALKKIPATQDIASFAYTAYHLLHKYQTRSASGAYTGPTDVSVFDHQRLLAAVVHCLTHEQNDLVNPMIADDPEFILLKGDISGIQKFIYGDIDLTQAGGSDKLSKKLRGRSFYVSWLTNFIAERLLEVLDLLEANLIYATGGHFMILAPNTSKIADKINEFTKDTNLKLRQKLGNEFNFMTAQITGKADLFANTSCYFTRLDHILQERKKYKAHEPYLEEIFHVSATDESVPETGDALKNMEDIWLGENMPYSEYVVELEIVPETLPAFQKELKNIKKYREQKREEYRSFVIDLTAWDRIFLMPKSRKDNNPNQSKSVTDFLTELIKILSSYTGYIQKIKFISLNNTNYEEIFPLQIRSVNNRPIPISFGFYFLGSESRQFIDDPKLLEKYQGKLNIGDVMPFDELQMLDFKYKESNLAERQYLSFPQLAVMRMDVDNLGGVFAIGLQSHASFTRLATLSRELHMFFGGYFNVLAHKYQLYTTYSGGDDAFLVGSWYNMTHFADELYTKFKQFTCKNQFLSFSAGLLFCHSRHPVGLFEKGAGELERLSKNYTPPGKSEVTKNAVTVFDHTLSWDSFQSMLDFSRKLLKYVASNDTAIDTKEAQKLSRALVHRLLRIIKSAIKQDGQVDVTKLYKNIARLHYLFARHGFNEAAIKNATDGLAKEVIKVIIRDFKDQNVVRDYLIPTSYVLWRTRELKSEN